MPNANTLVHPQETNVGCPFPASPALASPETDVGVAFRHAGWTGLRNRVLLAMESAGIATARRERFQACGSSAWIAHHPEDPSRVTLLAAHCHDRWCLPCARARAARLTARLFERARGRRLRFITLTVKTDDMNCTQALKKLMTSFRKLRQTKLWKACVKGGAAFTEIRYSSAAKRWHPHLHIVAEGKYLAHKALRNTWLAITKDSYIVDIRVIREEAAQMHYVAKYASKPFDCTVTSDDVRLREAITALHARRLCLAFGTWRGWRLNELHDPIAWVAMMPLEDCLNRARHGDRAAEQLILLLQENLRWQVKPPSG